MNNDHCSQFKELSGKVFILRFSNENGPVSVSIKDKIYAILLLILVSITNVDNLESVFANLIVKALNKVR